MLAPLAAVLLFLAAIVSAFWYLRLEEMDREQEAVKRDVEYGQQRMRLRLLERQEQLMRIARDISNKEVDAEEFVGRAESMIAQYPELLMLTWIDERRRVCRQLAISIQAVMADSAPTSQNSPLPITPRPVRYACARITSPLPTGETGTSYSFGCAAQGSSWVAGLRAGTELPASTRPLPSSRATAYLAETSVGTP